jgi:natural product precursor
MKKLNSLKLNDLSSNEMRKEDMNNLRGGAAGCGCGCLYSSSGGVDTMVNMAYNSVEGKSSSSYHDYITGTVTFYWNNGHFYMNSSEDAHWYHF